MSKKKRKKNQPKRQRGEYYIAIQFWEMESPAFRALSADATRVYLFMRKGLDFDCSNNGTVPFSHREATQVLNAGGWRRGSNAIAELEHYGFIKHRNGGEVGPNIRRASEWQLTAFPCGGQPALKDFMKGDRGPFEPPHRSAATRPQYKAEKQLPIGNMKTPRRQHEDTPPAPIQEKGPQNGQSVGNVKTLRAARRRQDEGTSTDTTQGGLRVARPRRRQSSGR
jgi:hypothetical protein